MSNMSDIKDAIKKGAKFVVPKIKNAAKFTGKKALQGAKWMAPRAGKVLKGAAKTGGKWTLKGVGKGLEMPIRAATKGSSFVMNRKTTQKILAAGVPLAAGMVIPAAGAGIVGAVGIKYFYDVVIKGEDKNILSEIGELYGMSEKFTNQVASKAISPSLDKVNNKTKEFGKAYQEAVNKWLGKSQNDEKNKNPEDTKEEEDRE